MQRSKVHFKICLMLLFPLTLAVKYLAARRPDIVERYYSGYIYPALSGIISSISGSFPFSLAEMLAVLSLVLLSIAVVYSIISIAKSPGRRLKILAAYVSTAMAALSVVYFCFIMLWGLNYHRPSFASIAGLEVRPASVEELENLCRYLIDNANRLTDILPQDRQNVTVSAGRINDILIRAEKGYQAASKIIPELGGNYGRPKGVMLSKIMSYQGIGGIYFPFTAEANVNISEPLFMIPFTAAHEMAHQRGFAREDEANYIGYLAAIMHPDDDFQYSGTMAALLYSMNALAKQDFERYTLLKQSYAPGVVRDFLAWNEHCKKHEGFLSRATDRVNDVYLQANAQQDGVQSYGRMVDLLLAHHRNRGHSSTF
jgi:hypothetical protein